MYTDTDKIWEQFLTACMKMPDNCALAKHATTSAELGEKLDTLIEELKYHQSPAGKDIINYSTVKNLIFISLHSPSQYPDFGGETRIRAY